MNFIIRGVLFGLLMMPSGIIAQELTREEVVFKNGDVVLNGTLVLPPAPQNVPVIIFMGGVEEWGELHPNREEFIAENLESYFPRNNVAILYYDPRGIGNSTGRWHHATLPEFAEDAKAAIRYLKQRREINSESIGIIGHGEDGWVAQIVAAENEDDLQFMISLAAPVYDAQTLLTNQYHNEYVCSGQDSSKAYEKARQKAISHENWVSIFPLTKRWRHMKMKQDFDPADKLKQIEIPALFVFGENDGEVYPSWSLEYLQKIFPNSLPPNFSIEIVSGANHYFKVADRCFEEEETSVQKNYSFRFREVLRNYIFEHL